MANLQQSADSDRRVFTLVFFRAWQRGHGRARRRPQHLACLILEAMFAFPRESRCWAASMAIRYLGLRTPAWRRTSSWFRRLHVGFPDLLHTYQAGCQRSEEHTSELQS